MGFGIRVTVEEKDNKLILRLDGRLDATSAPVLEKEIKPLLEKSTRMLMDFTEVDYLSSAGLRLLLFAAKKMKTKNGHLAFCGMGDDVLEIIKMAGFEKILNIFSTEKEALAAL